MSSLTDKIYDDEKFGSVLDSIEERYNEMCIAHPEYFNRYPNNSNFLTIPSMGIPKSHEEEFSEIIKRLNEAVDKVTGEVDMVNKPPHYALYKYEPIDVLQEWFGEDAKSPSPLAWQVCKYMARHKHKGKPLEDLKKARFYLDRLIKQYEEKQIELDNQISK